MGESGQRPSDRRVPLDVESDFLGDALVARVVVAPLAAGVLDAADRRDRVSALVQEGRQDVAWAALQAFAADQDLVDVGALFGACELPALGREVAEDQAAASPARALAEDERRWRQVGMGVGDRAPRALKRSDELRGARPSG